jgi:hypothetical protein
LRNSLDDAELKKIFPTITNQEEKAEGVSVVLSLPSAKIGSVLGLRIHFSFSFA